MRFGFYSGVNSVQVTDKEAYYYFSKNNNSPAKENNINNVTFWELLTDSLEVIESAIKEIEEGEDFRTVVLQHTKREGAKKTMARLIFLEFLIMIL